MIKLTKWQSNKCCERYSYNDTIEVDPNKCPFYWHDLWPGLRSTEERNVLSHISTWISFTTGSRHITLQFNLVSHAQLPNVHFFKFTSTIHISTRKQEYCHVVYKASVMYTNESVV